MTIVHKISTFAFLILAAIAMSSHAAEAASPDANFYVSTNGSDTNPGTATQPFATLSRAQDAVRGCIRAGLTSNITVFIRGGTYELTNPLVFVPEDSGTDQFSINYTAYSHEQVIISGGRKITGWKKAQHNLWSAEIPDVQLGKWYFRNLFVNGQRAIRARSPNIDAKNPFYSLKEVHLSQDLKMLSYRLDPNVVTRWVNLNDVEVVALHWWDITRKRIQNVEVNAGLVSLAPPHLRNLDGIMPGQGQKKCYLENALAFLDEPGEWYLNRTSGTLYYWPRPTDKMATASVIAPVLGSLVEIKGTATQPVKNLHFVGLEFSHTNWEPPEQGYWGRQGSLYLIRNFSDFPQKRVWQPIQEAIHLEYANTCSFSGCKFSHLGGNGIHIHEGSSSNLFTDNELFDIAATGMILGEDEEIRNYIASVTYSMPSEKVPNSNRISNNTIHHCGQIFHGSVGIWLQLAQNTLISHNLIYEMPYGGMTIGWVFKTVTTPCSNNIVEYNHIHHVMTMLVDGGAIRTIGVQPESIIRGNFLHDSGEAGLYFDNCTSKLLITSNVVQHCGCRLRFNTDRSLLTFTNDFSEAVLSTKGISGRALLGDGVASFYEATPTPRLATSQVTLEAWVNPHGSGFSWIAGQGISPLDGEYGLFVKSGYPSALVNIGGGYSNQFLIVSSSGIVPDGKWSHVAMTYDNTVLRVFLNGALVGSTVVNRIRTPQDGPFNIGRHSSKSYYFNGVIDEVRLYDKALTPAEIKTHYQSLSHTRENDMNDKLVGYWGLEDLPDPTTAINEIISRAGLKPQ